MKKTKRILLGLLIIAAIISLLPTGSVMLWFQNTSGKEATEVILDGFRIEVPDNWITFISTNDNSEKKVFRIIPYGYFPMQMLDKDMLDDLLVSFLIPHDGEYSSVYFLKMTNKDRVIQKEFERSLISSGESSAIVAEIVTVSRCSIKQWQCYKFRRVSNTDAAITFYFPDISLKLYVSKEFAKNIPTTIHIRRNSLLKDFAIDQVIDGLKKSKPPVSKTCGG